MPPLMSLVAIHQSPGYPLPACIELPFPGTVDPGEARPLPHRAKGHGDPLARDQILLRPGLMMMPPALPVSGVTTGLWMSAKATVKR